MKKVILTVVVLLVLPMVLGSFTRPYSFSTEDGELPTNVVARWIACTDSTCSNIVNNPSSNIFTPNPNFLGSDTELITEFPHCSETSYGYHLFFANEGYLFMIVSVSPYPCDYNTYTLSETNIKFIKQDNCKADFTSSVTSCAEAGLPLSILTDTELDAETSSAFTPNPPNIYFPDELKPWRNVSTQMLIDVKKQGSPSSELGFPQSQVYGIYSGTIHNFNFLWQTSVNTDPGYYDITMTSTVPDAKCDQTNMIPTVKTMTVYIAPSLDGCRAEIQNFNIDTTNIDINQELRFTGDKLNTYQNWSYTSISACEAENAQLTDGRIFNTQYTLTIEKDNQVIETLTGTLPNNDDYNTLKPFEISWTPTEYGDYTATITTQSAGNIDVCNNQGISASASTTFNIGNDNDNDGYYDLGGDCNDNNPLINPEAQEICDGINNDCDSEIDEGCNCQNGDTTPCSDLYYGMCAEGTALCMNGEWRGCPQASAEICDGQLADEDCDGYADCDDSDCINIFEDFRDICSNECQTDYYDINNDINDGCEYYCVFEGVEACDNIDNDCNGIIDDIPDSQKPLCSDLASIYLNQGVCKDALATCQNGEWICIPSNIPNFELEESSCDNLDNDCDGIVDSFTESLNEFGECSVNTRTCVEGNWAENIIYAPTTEICGDNLDNDCDGNIDEGCSCNPGSTRQCGSTNIGECKYGQQTCLDTGVWGSCENAVYPTTEVCDNLDNDCDTEIDEGNAQCCSPIGKTRNCNDDPKCPGYPGRETCINYQWSNICKADCPKPKPELIINNPEQDSRYYTCDDTLKIPLDINYPGLCQYQLNSMKSFRNAGATITAHVGSNRLTVKCSEEVKSVGFQVIKNDNCKTYKQKIDDDTKDLFKDEGLDENLIEKAENTPANHELSFSTVEDNTYITSSIIPEKELKDFDYYLYIPKCVLEELGDISLKDLDIAYRDYKIIKEDPIIAWHFDNVDDRIDLNINAKGKISEDCLKQIRGLPIAKALGFDVYQEKPFKLRNFIAPIIVALIAFSIVGESIYMRKYHHFDEPQSEKEYEDIAVKHGYDMLYKKIKERNFKTAQQADNEMKNLNYTKEEREYILKKLKLK